MSSLRRAIEDSMQDIGLGTDERLDRAEARIRASLTPLQREVATEPTCSRCSGDITRLDDLYRCAQCHAAFDLACIREHFNWGVNPRPHEAPAREEATSEPA